MSFNTDESNQPANASDSVIVKLPQKRYFRQRAHANPFSDHLLEYPMNPDEMNWKTYYPEMPDTDKVEFADIGCGYGGLLVALANLFSGTYMLGMEIRTKVSDYVQQRIVALRQQNPGKYQNIACIRGNAMKFLPNFFQPRQLSKIFFLFPDPHFKTKKHKARIISHTLLSEYAFFLRPGGMIYTATDVKDLHDWMVEKLDSHRLFERIPNDHLVNDQVVKCVLEKTEEGIKVARNNGDKYLAVYRRLP